MKKSQINTLLILGLTIIASCGKDSSSGPKRLSLEQQQQEEMGHYRAVMEPLNSSVSGNQASGTALINLKEEIFEVKLNIINAPSAIKHLQAVHTGGDCPNPEHDSNQDGFLDIQEGSKHFGKILIPLDADLSSQQAGTSYGPTSSAYSYSESTEWKKMMTDLQSPDENPEDFVQKLAPSSFLNLAGRSFVVLGVSSKVSLPQSVATMNQLPAHLTLPIACGKIMRVRPE
jgi:hypothetical protein